MIITLKFMKVFKVEDIKTKMQNINGEKNRVNITEK